MLTRILNGEERVTFVLLQDSAQQSADALWMYLLERRLHSTHTELPSRQSVMMVCCSEQSPKQYQTFFEGKWASRNGSIHIVDTGWRDEWPRTSSKRHVRNGYSLMEQVKSRAKESEGIQYTVILDSFIDFSKHVYETQDTGTPFSCVLRALNELVSTPQIKECVALLDSDQLDALTTTWGDPWTRFSMDMEQWLMHSLAAQGISTCWMCVRPRSSPRSVRVTRWGMVLNTVNDPWHGQCHTTFYQANRKRRTERECSIDEEYHVCMLSKDKLFHMEMETLEVRENTVNPMDTTMDPSGRETSPVRGSEESPPASSTALPFQRLKSTPVPGLKGVPSDLFEGVPFNLTLTQTQRHAKAHLELPYLRAQRASGTQTLYGTASSHDIPPPNHDLSARALASEAKVIERGCWGKESTFMNHHPRSSGALIHYYPDQGDDVDEEDPDADLTI